MNPMCIVSGRSAGIGASTVQKFIEMGYQVINLDLQPGEVAELIYFLASDNAAFITGSMHAIDGGYTA